MRLWWASVVAVLAALSSTVGAAPREPGFYPAEQYFNGSLGLRDRLAAQILLIGAGLQNIVPTERLQPKSFEATREFQGNVGLPPNGILDPSTRARLSETTGSLFQLWNFAEIAHPWRGHPIWMPQGMGLQLIPNKTGLTYRDPAERVEVHYNFFPGAYIDKSYVDTLATLRAKGVQVHFAVQKDDWYVISSTSPQGIDGYRRYHIDGNGILGFTLFWNNARGNVNGERIAVLMSASLGALMAGRPFVEPQYFARSTVAAPQPQPAGLPLAYAPSSQGSVSAAPPLPPTLAAGTKLKVINIADNDVLKIREQPSDSSRVVSTIPPDGFDVEFLGERSDPWIFVRYERAEGWVSNRFVAYEPRRGRKLEENE